MEIIILIVVLILLIPLYVQLKYGVRAICGWIKLKFWQFTLLNFFGELILSVLMFFILIAIQDNSNRSKCGLGLEGIVVFGLPISIAILLLAIIQNFSIK